MSYPACQPTSALSDNNLPGWNEQNWCQAWAVAGQTIGKHNGTCEYDGCCVSGQERETPGNWVWYLRLDLEQGEVYDVLTQSMTSLLLSRQVFAIDNGVNSLIYDTVLSELDWIGFPQYKLMFTMQSYLLHWRSSPAHFEDGAAGLYDGHQHQGGNTGNNHVQLDIGINLIWLVPLISVMRRY